MPSAQAMRRTQSRRRPTGAKRAQQRRDLQGLRMVAVVLVFANHLWGWPRGGFIGVDVFFVISGFLITGNLLRTAAQTGNVSFKRFYWNRVRRIIPAATVVLILTCIASLLIFQPFRAQQVGIDAFFAFIFMSNWWFAIQATDYFGAYESVSPIQHFWSLSIEEQFYFVWPALIFLIGLVVIRKSWTDGHRMRLTAIAMGVVIAASLGWAWYESATTPTSAYFNTFARVWELGVGALLATAVGPLARIHVKAKPWLSWAGLGLIVASVVLIAEGTAGFPAPWALLPVVGSAMVIAAGVGGEPQFQGFLRNQISVYLGDISYSLYLVHWPVIVLLSALTAERAYPFAICATALSLGLAITSYHFVENPLRYATRGSVKSAVRKVRHRQFRTSSRNAAAGALTLVVAGVVVYTLDPQIHHPVPPPAAFADAAATPVRDETKPKMGPLTTALQPEIMAALDATQWPTLDPPIETLHRDETMAGVHECVGGVVPDPEKCTFGSPDAPVRIVLLGDSVAANYSEPLREIALNSGGQIQIHTEAMSACEPIDDLVTMGDAQFAEWCPGRKQHAIDFINATKPDVVIISHSYGEYKFQGTNHEITFTEWADSTRRFVEKFRDSTKKVVFLAQPPGVTRIVDCYGLRSSTPPDCVSGPGRLWMNWAQTEQDLAKSFGGSWIDSRLWFCSPGGRCPSFVGSTPTKNDDTHMTEAYGQRIQPVIRESLIENGVF
jgi:peptidoglycan/LPS O-acetylase OafA/YrhL